MRHNYTWYFSNRKKSVRVESNQLEFVLKNYPLLIEGIDRQGLSTINNVNRHAVIYFKCSDAFLNVMGEK